MGALLRFAVFTAVVLALPAALMRAGDPRLADLGKLALILAPPMAGTLLNRGLGDRGVAPRWREVAMAAAITLLVALGAVGIALAVGAANLHGRHLPPPLMAVALGGTALTSVLEELGWAGGGLGLALAAFGRRWGVSVLGLVWAAWHLIPAFLKIGLFPELQTARPAMLAAFVVACLIYRELLTALRERARTWWAAAAGHAAPNLLLAGLMGLGLTGFERPGGWPFYPAPGGLVFPLLALIALLALPRTRDDRPETGPV